MTASTNQPVPVACDSCGQRGNSKRPLRWRATTKRLECKVCARKANRGAA